MKTTRSLIAALANLALSGLLLFLASCGHESATEDPARPAARTYEVRGEIRQLPDPAHPSQELMVRHEAIPNFLGMDGVIEPMGSMTMPFPVADDEVLEGLQVGDIVKMTFTLDWNAERALEVKTFEKLPADTTLSFDAAAAAEPPAEGHDHGDPPEPEAPGS